MVGCVLDVIARQWYSMFNVLNDNIQVFMTISFFLFNLYLWLQATFQTIFSIRIGTDVFCVQKRKNRCTTFGNDYLWVFTKTSFFTSASGYKHLSNFQTTHSTRLRTDLFLRVKIFENSLNQITPMATKNNIKLNVTFFNLEGVIRVQYSLRTIP